MRITASRIDRYELIGSVGRGKFSEVFKAYDKENEEYVSIKHLKPVRREKIRRFVLKSGGLVISRCCREILVMEDLKNGPSILPLLDVVKDEEADSPNLVTKWVNTLPYRVRDSLRDPL